MTDCLINLIKYIETYRGRDKVIRATSYLSCLLGGILEKNKSNYSQKLFIFMNELNGCRIILRLFDDLSMLAYSLNYGLGKVVHLFYFYFI